MRLIAYLLTGINHDGVKVLLFESMNIFFYSMQSRTVSEIFGCHSFLVLYIRIL